jgi:hypothetical protein
MVLYDKLLWNFVLNKGGNHFMVGGGYMLYPVCMSHLCTIDRRMLTFCITIGLHSWQNEILTYSSFSLFCKNGLLFDGVKFNHSRKIAIF